MTDMKSNQPHVDAMFDPVARAVVDNWLSGFCNPPLQLTQLQRDWLCIGIGEAIYKECEQLTAALREIETICTESSSDCRKRMGTRAGNSLVTARAALATGEEPKP